MSQTPLEEKQKLRSQMQEEGTYKGFKLRNYYKGIGGVTDKIEQFNWCVLFPLDQRENTSKGFAFSPFPAAKSTSYVSGSAT